ncbi:ChaN family lipoprotein [bacterium]|nr:ChaN family lipoprotein [bacterium]
MHVSRQVIAIGSLALLLCLAAPGWARAGSADEMEPSHIKVPKRIYATAPDGSWARSGLVHFSTLIEQLSGADVVFIGEQHDDPATHALQLEILKALTEACDGRVTLSLEQFERDVQGALDDYLAGRADEETFLASSRPWPNYPEHYRPLVEFCRERGLPVIAANIPRPLASKVAKEGFEAAWDAYTPQEHMWVAKQTTHPKDAYYELFILAMGGHGAMPMGEDAVDQFYAAQCIKDDTMAESIQLQLESQPYRRVVHMNGSFHSDYWLGTVDRLHQRLPLSRIVTISVRPVDSWCDCDRYTELLPAEAAALHPRGEDPLGVPLADYVIFVMSPDWGAAPTFGEPPVEEELPAEMPPPQPATTEGEQQMPPMPMPPPEGEAEKQE